MQGPWDSWEGESSAPVADNSVFAAQSGEFSFNPLVWGVRLFQRFISSVDGARCSMYPTCSHYSLLAFKKHGPIMGYIMTTDRLIHESDEPRFVPRIEKHGIIRFYDPLENNDFWWSDSNSPDREEEKN
jgi:putative membrane protein insertion efficiency factor